MRRASAFWGALLFLLTAAAGHAQLKVLFIGNSFTQGNTAPVPTIFDRLAQAGGQGDPLTVMRAVGGTDFQYHTTNSLTLSTIASEDWDYVVMQNYSTQPTHIGDVAAHFTYGTNLYQVIMANHSLTKVVLYETWARAAAHSLITGTSGPNSFASTAEMQAELRTNYFGLASHLNANFPSNPKVVVAPVGDAWENAGGLRAASDPLFVDLHGNDNYHADDDGDYLTAATIYSTIFQSSPEGLSTHAAVASLNLSRNVSALALEQTAWTTVQAVPEPGAVSLLLGGMALLAGRRQCRAHRVHAR